MVIDCILYFVTTSLWQTWYLKLLHISLPACMVCTGVTCGLQLHKSISREADCGSEVPKVPPTHLPAFPLIIFVLVGSTVRKCVLRHRADEIVAGEVTLLVVKEEWVQTSVSHFAVHVHHVGLSVLSARVLLEKKKKIQDSSSELTRWFPSRCLSASLLWSVLSRHMLCNNPSPYEFNCTYYFQHAGQRFGFCSIIPVRSPSSLGSTYSLSWRVSTGPAAGWQWLDLQYETCTIKWSWEERVQIWPPTLIQ